MIDDLLTYSADFYAITKSQNELGTPSKSRALLYSAVPCRLLEVKSGWKPNAGESEGTQERFKIVCAAKWDGANEGDQVEVEGKTYTISRRFVQRDEEEINHLVYFLIENE